MTCAVRGVGLGNGGGLLNLLEKLVCGVGGMGGKEVGSVGCGVAGLSGVGCGRAPEMGGGVRLGKSNSKIWHFTAGNKIM